MTVRRSGEAAFAVGPQEITQQALYVLRNHPEYKSITASPAGRTLTATVWPDWWLLPTRMTVQLEPLEGATRVRVSTRSQVFIMGDVLGYYTSYIQQFLRRLTAAVSPTKSD